MLIRGICMLFNFFKKKTPKTYSYKTPIVKIPKQYDKMFSLTILLEREGVSEKTRKAILSDPNPFFKAKQNFMTIVKRDYLFSFQGEQYKRYSRLIRLYTVQRAPASAVIEGFFEYMIAQLCCTFTWNPETRKPDDKSRYKYFFKVINSENSASIIKLYDKLLISCFADAVLRSGKNIEDVVNSLDDFVTYNLGKKTLDGSFCTGIGKEKALSCMRNSIQAFFEEEKPYSLSSLLLMPNTKSSKSLEEEKPLFELGKEIMCNEKGKYYLATDNDIAFIESLYPEINNILKTAYKEVKGFPLFDVRNSTFDWKMTSDYGNPSLIIKSTCTKTGKEPKYPYVIHIHEGEETASLTQINLSLSNDGRIRRLEYLSFKGSALYKLIATETKDKTLKISNAYKIKH